jgi:hypothetical protein
MPAFKALASAASTAAAALTTAALASVLCLSGCLFEKENGKENRSTAQQGGGSETTLTGRVVDASGAPVSGAAVRIRLQSDLPPNLFSDQPGEVAAAPQTYSGPDGQYQVQGLASGSYFVECRATSGLAALVSTELRPDDSVRLPDAVLLPTGVIKGRVTAPLDSTFSQLSAVYVYLLGIWKRDVAQESTGHAFMFTDVPAGTYTLRAQAAYPRDLSHWNVLERNLDLGPGDTLDLDTLVLPERAAVHDPAYTRDSAAAFAFYLASLDSGEIPEPDWVEQHFAVTGNRITMFYHFHGDFKRASKNILALDALEYIYLMGQPQTRLELAPEISRLPNLKYFFLEHYDLSGLPAWTGSFPSLINLALNDLKTFPEWIYEIPSLTSVGLGDSIASVPKGISRLKHLRHFGVGSRISAFPTELLRMPSLEGVNLRYNHICETTAEEKAFLDRQDSLIFASYVDPLINPMRDTLKWEATMKCGE